MQDEHGFIWQAKLDTIDVDLTGRRRGVQSRGTYLLHDLAGHAAAAARLKIGCVPLSHHARSAGR